MSGREHEPIAAFFPSIDRNLIRDLDRHLRTPQPVSEAQALGATAQADSGTAKTLTAAPPPSVTGASTQQAAFTATTSAQAQAPAQQPRPTVRPNIAGVLEAVEHAAHSMASMTTRIEELEHQLELAETQNRQLEAQLDEVEQRHKQIEGKLKLESDRASRFESVAGQQAARTMELERELMSLHSDLVRVSEAVASALGYQDWTENLRA